MAKRKNTPARRTNKGHKSPPRATHTPVPTSSGRPLIYGKHAVLAALANPDRKIHRLILTPEARESLQSEIQNALKNGSYDNIETTIMDKRELADRLPVGAVHQGLALEVEALRGLHIEDIIDLCENDPTATIIILDQASDPHNIGAILRSAAAFGAAAVVIQDRHAPDITPVMAKAASGALERVALIRVTNLARAMDKAKEAGFWCIGLDGQAEASLGETDLTGRVALVLGSEGSGLRRLTREHCDLLVKVPISGAVESLNLSNAAAIALYEKARQ
ncbi:MAG: 23S rRNA (guanosine(2251)-2'-O)-methyltransferase RlmB [Rhodospirillaceae bacterium]|nr:23S rRNA (guanosine(2251)-2'-O)-methyltransferase RlmB [Rhodospirillaceae bacterium]